MKDQIGKANKNPKNQKKETLTTKPGPGYANKKETSKQQTKGTDQHR